MSENSINPEWASPEKVEQACDSMQRVEDIRARDRSMVNNLANGGRPWTPEEAKEFSIQVNINWLELTRKLQDAIGQINGAFIPATNFFTCHSEAGNVTKKDEYGRVFTKEINGILHKGNSGWTHHFLLRSRNAAVALHGLGPLYWSSPRRMLPRFVPLEDLLIPTDTDLNFRIDLSHFAVNLYLPPGELYRLACTGKPDKEWNQEVVRNILKDTRDDKNIPLLSPNLNDWTERPEYVTELYKQNRGFLDSDAVPRCRLRAFYYQDPETNDAGIQPWYRKIVLRDNLPSVESRKAFVYDGKDEFADDIGHILHCQVGDNSLVAPLKYHSVRGLGTMLYGPGFTLNKLRCQAVQHIFNNLLTFWRISDPADRDRLRAILLQQFGIVPDGASIVPNAERHQIDARLLEFGMAQMKQNLAENATSYTPESDSGTRKERTAFEVRAQLQMSQAAVGNVLSMMYAQEVFYYAELVRRALIKNTDDPNAIKFQQRCRAKGIPDKLMVPQNWRIVPERVLGGGDNMLAQAQADALMSRKETFEPESQRKIQRLWASTLLDDPERAAELVPNVPDTSTSGTRTAEDLYGTLMRGIAVPMRKGIDHQGYCAALLSMLEVSIQTINQTDGVGTQQDIIGFASVARSVEENLQFLAMDETNKEAVKLLSDKLGKLMNDVKAFVQRQQEAAQEQQAPMDPEAQAKAASIIQLTQAKMQSSEATTQQKLQHKQQAFVQKQQQQSQKHAATLQEKGAQLGAQLATQQAQTEQELATSRALTTAELLSKGAQTGADIEATKLKANAKPTESD